MITKNSLFPAKEMYRLSCGGAGKIILPNCSTYRERQLKYNNMHLLEGIKFTETNEFPIVAPYNGTTDFELVSYHERKRANKSNAIHFFIDDTQFAKHVFNDIERVTYQLLEYDYVFGPDYSLFIDAPLQLNKMGVYQNRFVSAHWQNVGLNVVPTASWSDVDSLTYAFEGLPKNSVIGVSGQGHHKASGLQTLFNWAIQEMELQLHPTEILIYGEPEDIPGIHTPLRFYSDYIHTRLRHGK